eukprot:1208642-Amphidinium_carterae.1
MFRKPLKRVPWMFYRLHFATCGCLPSNTLLPACSRKAVPQMLKNVARWVHQDEGLPPDGDDASVRTPVVVYHKVQRLT